MNAAEMGNHETTKETFDVAVIGGGPAGSAAAAIAARQGLSVVLLERDETPRFKVGESLMPETYGTFEKMGALEEMKASDFVEKHSVQFYSKSGKASSPFYFASERPEERARTWQVLRSDFDSMLLDVAAEQGAEIRRGVRVREVLRDGERVYGAHVEELGSRRRTDVHCKVLIDASGQSSVVARTMDVPRVDYGLNHASIYTHFAGAIRDEGIDEGATLILHTDDASTWFWYIPLPNDVVSVGVVGPVDQLIRGREGTPTDTFYAEVERCKEIGRRIAPAEQCRDMAVIRDFSYRSEQLAGDGWILVGDAYSFIDPVYSSGVFLALKSGELAAETAAAAIAEEDLSAASLSRFEPGLASGIDAIRRLVEVFYDPEFSVGGFLREHRDFQRDVTRILIGDVFDRDFQPMFTAMKEWLAASEEAAVASRASA